MRKLNRWTTEEVKTLRENCHKGFEELKKKFPERSEQSIRTKCTYLDLSIGEQKLIVEKLYMVI